jgi:hypothetical protein
MDFVQRFSIPGRSEQNNRHFLKLHLSTSSHQVDKWGGKALCLVLFAGQSRRGEENLQSEL